VSRPYSTILDGQPPASPASSAVYADKKFRSNNTDIISNDKTFEVDGANAAREFVRKEDKAHWDKHRIQLVWDAIALHTTAEINRYKEAEVLYTAAGTYTELVGPEIAKQSWVRDTRLRVASSLGSSSVDWVFRVILLR